MGVRITSEVIVPGVYEDALKELINGIRTGKVSAPQLTKSVQRGTANILKSPKYLRKFRKVSIELFKAHIDSRRDGSGNGWRAQDDDHQLHIALIKTLKKNPDSRYGRIRLPQGQPAFWAGKAKKEVDTTQVKVFPSGTKTRIRFSHTPKAIHPHFQYPSGSRKKTKAFSNTTFAIAHGEQIPTLTIRPKRAKALAIGLKGQFGGTRDERNSGRTTREDNIIISGKFTQRSYNTKNTSYYEPYFTLSQKEKINLIVDTFKKVGIPRSLQ